MCSNYIIFICHLKSEYSHQLWENFPSFFMSGLNLDNKDVCSVCVGCVEEKKLNAFTAL